MLIDDRWASAREDLAHMYAQADMSYASHAFEGAGSALAAQAAWYAQRAQADGNGQLADAFMQIAQRASSAPDAAHAQFASDVAVVTGVSAHSIAGEVVAAL
ncbi:hypothetical protein QP510_10290, partial [Bifidobacterium breve]